MNLIKNLKKFLNNEKHMQHLKSNKKGSRPYKIRLSELFTYQEVFKMGSHNPLLSNDSY